MTASALLPSGTSLVPFLVLAGIVLSLAIGFFAIYVPMAVFRLGRIATALEERNRSADRSRSGDHTNLDIERRILH